MGPGWSIEKEIDEVKKLNRESKRVGEFKVKVMQFNNN